MKDNYSKAYTEVLEILKSIPEEQYNLIPKQEIEFYTKNADREYKFEFDPQIPLEKQKILRETYVVLVTIYRDFFLDDKKKKVLEEILELNSNMKGKKD